MLRRPIEDKRCYPGLLAARSLASLLLVIALASVLSGCGYRGARVYEFPAGFRGWALIKYGVESCPPLSTEGGAALYRVPASRVLCTSSKWAEGWGNDAYFWTGPARGEIPAGGAGDTVHVQGPFVGSATGNQNFWFEAFFIGTVKEHAANETGFSGLISAGGQ